MADKDTAPANSPEPEPARESGSHQHPHRTAAEAAVHTAPGRPAAVLFKRDAHGHAAGDVVRAEPALRAAWVEAGVADPATDDQLALAGNRVKTHEER